MNPLFLPGEGRMNDGRELLARLLASLERRGIGPTDHEFWTVPDKIVTEIEAHLNKVRGQD